MGATQVEKISQTTSPKIRLLVLPCLMYLQDMLEDIVNQEDLADYKTIWTPSRCPQ